MARERPRRPDLDEKFSLHPSDGEQVLKKLLGSEDVPIDEDDPSEDEEH